MAAGSGVDAKAAVVPGLFGGTEGGGREEEGENRMMRRLRTRSRGGRNG